MLISKQPHVAVFLLSQEAIPFALHLNSHPAAEYEPKSLLKCHDLTAGHVHTDILSQPVSNYSWLMLHTTVPRIVEFEDAPYRCTRRLGGLPFSVRLLSPTPRGVRNAYTIIAPARVEGEVETSPTFSRTNKDAVG